MLFYIIHSSIETKIQSANLNELLLWMKNHPIPCICKIQAENDCLDFCCQLNYCLTSLR
jgi:hypothetical protein